MHVLEDLMYEYDISRETAHGRLKGGILTRMILGVSENEEIVEELERLLDRKSVV